ncbi:MAG: PA14 domain-containing protein [Anaerolineae bacterium]|jgi:hypothetical protein
MKRFFAVAIVVAVALVVLVALPGAQAQSGNSWLVDYYPNTEWAGYPAYSQTVAFANLNWGSSAPGPNMPSANWTARFTSSAFFYSGVYSFSVLADDEAVLMIDNVVYLDTRGQGLSGKTQFLDIPLSQGTHSVRVDFRQYSGTAYITVNWVLAKGPGPTPGPNPTPTPLAPPPPQQSSVVTRYGDYTPCIQQNIHQVNCFQSDGAWNSPNEGSIQMEPKIQYWGNCTADSIATYQVSPEEQPMQFKCSKTEAGYFPN